MLVFECYLDDSGTSGLPVVTMAGFIASISQWQEIETASDAAMNRYGVPIFHAKEFHDTKGVFSDWTKLKKRSFAKEVFGGIAGQMFAVSMSARRSGFEAAKKSTGKFQSMSAYGLCFSAIMTRLVLDFTIGEKVRREGVSFLIESGNKNNAELEGFFHMAAKEKAFEGCMRSITFIPKDRCRAIQLADYWAFYSRRYMRDHDRFDGRLRLPSNFFLDQVLKNFPHWQQGTHDMSKPVALSHIGRFDSFKDFEAFVVSQAKKK